MVPEPRPYNATYAEQYGDHPVPALRSGGDLPSRYVDTPTHGVAGPVGGPPQPVTNAAANPTSEAPLAAAAFAKVDAPPVRKAKPAAAAFAKADAPPVRKAKPRPRAVQVQVPTREARDRTVRYQQDQSHEGLW